jgi:hypothetical protein
MSSEGFAGPLCKAVWNDEERCKGEQGRGKRCLLGVVVILVEEEEGKDEGGEAEETVMEGIRDEEEKRRKIRIKLSERRSLKDSSSHSNHNSTPKHFASAQP